MRDVIWSIAARPSRYQHHGKDSVLCRVKRKIEYAKAQLRAKVERPFHVIKVRFNHRKVRLSHKDLSVDAIYDRYSYSYSYFDEKAEALSELHTFLRGLLQKEFGDVDWVEFCGRRMEAIPAEDD